MPTTFRPCAPDQSFLFPPSPRDWLPEGHLAFFIADTVAALDLHGFYGLYDGDGRRNQPFDPQMMVTVLVYAYATGTLSSRRIARKLEEDVAYRVLAAGNFPAHRTIAEFRQQYSRPSRRCLCRSYRSRAKQASCSSVPWRWMGRR